MEAASFRNIRLLWLQIVIELLAFMQRGVAYEQSLKID